MSKIQCQITDFRINYWDPEEMAKTPFYFIHTWLLEVLPTQRWLYSRVTLGVVKALHSFVYHQEHGENDPNKGVTKKPLTGNCICKL